MKVASIAEVAERAAVSIATASRVMSNANYPVSETTRQRVLTAATDLNYRPNSLARSLKTRRSRLIAVLVGDNVDPYFAEITRGVEEVATESGYLTIVCNTDRKPAKELSYIQTLQDYRVDGLLFAGGGLNEDNHPAQLEAQVKHFQELGTAVITLAQHTLAVPSVQADNFGGAKIMTRRLLELGHRRIGFVAGPANLVVANVRLQGYLAALAEAGIPLDPALIVQGDFSIEGGERATRMLAYLSEEQRPTALFASNDETAFGVFAAARHMGWRVPNDISVCGFGDLPIARLVTPALTTVHMPLREVGQRGARKLIAILNGETVEKNEIMAVNLIERESIGPVTA